jgi:hypothetical protein
MATSSRVACFALSYSISMRGEVHGCASKRTVKSILCPARNETSIFSTAAKTAQRNLHGRFDSHRVIARFQSAVGLPTMQTGAFTRSSGSRSHAEAPAQQFAERPCHRTRWSVRYRGPLFLLGLGFDFFAAIRLCLRSGPAVLRKNFVRGKARSGNAL